MLAGLLRTLFCSLLLVVSVGSTASAQSEADAQARAHFRLGRAHYDNGQFLQAAKEFEAAHRISGRAALLYNVYLSYRDANDSENAARALRRFLAEEKEIENRPQLQAKLKALEAGLAEEKARQGATPVQPVPVAPAQPAQPAPEQTQPPPAEQPAPAAAEPAPAEPEPEYAEGDGSKTNLVPFILMGVGGAMVVGSIFTGLSASSSQSDAEEACPTKMNCDPSLQDTLDSGETMALVTDILLFGGIAVAGTGAVLFILDQGKGDSSGATAGLACVPGACAGVVRGSF